MIKIKSTVFFTLFVNFILSSHLFASDLDIDAVLDDVDNCIFISNSDQANFDDDRFGDACDIDDDNDGLLDRFDPYPFNANLPENADKRLVVTNSRIILSGKNELAAVGTTLDVDDNWIAVGSAAEDPRGVVYLLENQGQGVHHVVQKLDGNENSRTFGRSVDLNMAANLLTVSDSNSNTGGTQAGQVLNYSFVDGQWSLFGESIPGGSTYSFLSNSKSNEQGDFLVVRSAAHVLRTYTLSNESWVEVGSRLGEDLSDDLFAHDYELSGDGATLFVGASRTDGLNVGSDVGAFYKYERIEEEWVLADQVDGLFEGGRFGEQLALSDTGRYLAVTEQGRGYIYVYDLLAADWKATPLVIQQPFYTWEFGWSIEFSEDGKILFVGTYSGEHFIYYDDGISWRLLADTSHDFRMPSRGYGRIVGVDKDGSNYYVASPESSVSYLRGGSLEAFSIDYDSDLDGIADADDALPLVSLQGRLDTDRDGLPDQCDTFCGLDGLEEDLDDDNDGILDVDDKRPKASSALFIDTDLDGLPDYCGQHCFDLGLIGDEDDDEDGVEDAFDAFPLDSMYFADTDVDGIADELDDDIDGDGVSNEQDLFPFDHNESSDTDGDGVGDNSDLFPQDASESADLDGDGIGDAADDDIDGDGVGNLDDAFPFDATESIDSDNDGTGNNTDIDDDNDGILDVLDSKPLDVEAALGHAQLLWVETYSRVGARSNENLGASVAISADGKTLAYSSADIDASGQQGLRVLKQSLISDNFEESVALTPNEAPRVTSIDLSADGNSLVVSDSGASVGSTQTGAVSVFDYDSGIWQQRGSATSRAVVYDFLRRVTINSDGQIVGVGSLTNRLLEGGFAGVLRFNGVSWETVGDYIFGNESGSQLSSGLAMNALGTVVAAGAPTGDGYSGTPIDGGRVEVYQYQQGNWVQLGQTLYGSVNNQKFGASVSLNEDGDVLAVGSSQGDKVNIYRLEQDAWVDFGEIEAACDNSVDGAWRGVELDKSGFIISVARHCYNAYTHDETYYYDGSAWRSLSAPLDVRANELHSAVETSLSGDGLRRLVGIPLSDSEGLTDNGAVKLYSLKLDSDGDGIVDEYDSYPLNAFAFADSDRDGVPDSIGETISMNVATGRALSKAQYEGYIRIDFNGYGDSNTGDNLYDDAFYYFNPNGTPYRYEKAIMQFSDAAEVPCFNTNSSAPQKSIVDLTVFVDGIGVPSEAFQMPYSESHTYSIVVDLGAGRRSIALGHGDCGYWDNEGVISARITPVEAIQSLEGELFIDAVFEDRGGPFDAFPLDASETLDTDLDGIGNNADTDDDGDGVLDQSDAFPTNPLYSSDVDLDGIADEIDNCVPVANADQLDTDGDGIGDSCADLIGLQALYQSTNGDGWTSDTAWLVDGNYCTWLGVQCDSFGRVIDIDLIGNNLAGSIPAEIGALSELKVLKLAQNNLTGEIPTSIGSLLKLQELYLGSNRISGLLPRELGALSNLKILEVPYNRLSGPIPAEIGQLVSLEILSLTDNGFTGGIPDEIGNLTNLARLYINGTDLGGKIPASVGGMVSLNILQLTASNLIGEIPQEIMSLPNLGVLHLNDNKLSGVISEELGSYLAARSLILYGNAFICPYPTALADLFESYGELCLVDNDGDTIPDAEDNCPNESNISQLDSDSDGSGDDCDTDDDNDGIDDYADAFPLDPTEAVDTDNDGIGNKSDPDDDNDGLTDKEEIALGLDPLLKDSDQDGILDAEDQTSVVIDSVFPQLTMSVITPDVAPLWSDSRLLSPSGCMIEPVALEFGENTSYYIHNFHPNTPSGIYKVGSDTPRVGHAGGVLYDQSVYLFEITNDSGVASSPQIESYNITPRPDSQEIQIEITLTNVVGGIPRYYPSGNDTRLAATVRLVFSDDTSQYFGFEFYPDDIEVISETSYKVSRTVLVPVQWDVQAARVNSFHTCDAALNFFSTTSQNDTDLDGAADLFDAFPDDPLEFLDTDADRLGNNADTDDDGDGYADEIDLFPYDPAEWVDFDGDGIGDNADLDDDGDGVNDIDDAFPLNANEVADADGDGVGDNDDLDSVLPSIIDENLKNCVQSQSSNRVSDLIQLSCEYMGIVSLVGLDDLSALDELFISGNPIDWSTLPSMPDLRRLFVNSSTLESLSQLAPVAVSLIDLDASWNQISNLNGIENFPASITGLNVAHNKVTDLTPLQDSNIVVTYLNLGENAIFDMSPLAYLKTWQQGEVGLWDNPIRKIGDSLVGWSNLRVNLERTPLSCQEIQSAQLHIDETLIVTWPAPCFDDPDRDYLYDGEDAFPNDAAAAVDTDGDGMPDDWNPNVTAEQIAASKLTLDADDDNDGYSDAYELETGTDPLDATDFKPPYDDLNGVVYHWSQHSVMADVGVDRSGISALTGSDGNYLFNETPEGRYDLSASLAISEYDTNRTITSADALAALKIAVGLNPNSDPDGDGPLEALAASPYQLIAADINQDGRVTSADALAILKVAVGLGDALEPSWKLVEDSQALWSTHSDKSNVFDASQAYALTYPNQTQVDFSAILLGDVNASWRPQEGTASLDHGHFSSHAKTTGAPLSLWGIRDSDEDGLSDEQEDALGTSPIDADSDDDGINDNDDAYPLDPDKFEDVPAGVQPEPILSASPKKVDVSAITLVNPVLLRGDMNDWGEGDVFTRLEDGSYSLTKKLSPGTYTFKIATSEWVIMDLGAKDEESRLIVLDRAVQLAADSNASFVLEVDAERELVFLVESDSAGIAVLRVSELQ